MAEPVLLISPYYPPRARVGALRAAKFATYLPEFGFEPHIVSLDAGRPGESVHRLKTPVDRTHKTSSSALGKGAASDRLSMLDRMVPVDTWLPVMWWNRAEVVEFAKEKNIRLVWSTGDPWSGHLLASSVAQALDVPWIADWRDPWSLCKVRNLGRPRWTRRIDAAVERTWMSQATMNTFTAEETTRRYVEAYGVEASTIYNAFDQDVISAGEPDPAGERVELVFFGRFRELSPAEPVIRMVAACKDPARVRVVSFGSMPEADVRLAEALGVAECFVTEAPVPYTQAASRLRRAHILLLSTDPRRDDIIPAKLWDYLPIGRPILSLAPNPEVDRLIAATGTGVGGDPVAQLNAWLDQPSSPRHTPDVDRIRTYSARSATAQLASLMRGLLP